MEKHWTRKPVIEVRKLSQERGVLQYRPARLATFVEIDDWLLRTDKVSPQAQATQYEGDAWWNALLGRVGYLADSIMIGCTPIVVICPGAIDLVAPP